MVSGVLVRGPLADVGLSDSASAASQLQRVVRLASLSIIHDPECRRANLTDLHVVVEELVVISQSGSLLTVGCAASGLLHVRKAHFISTSSLRNRDSLDCRAGCCIHICHDKTRASDRNVGLVVHPARTCTHFLSKHRISDWVVKYVAEIRIEIPAREVTTCHLHSPSSQGFLDIGEWYCATHRTEIKN